MQNASFGVQSAPYHCSIHPEMIGSINQDSLPTTPAPSLAPSY